MDHGAGALPILFMLAAEMDAAGSLQLYTTSKKSLVDRRRIRVDALGELHLLAALTKLSQSAQRTRFITGWILSVVPSRYLFSDATSTLTAYHGFDLRRATRNAPPNQPEDER
jgi:hypothetical protein